MQGEMVEEGGDREGNVARQLIRSVGGKGQTQCKAIRAERQLVCVALCMSGQPGA